VRYFCQGIRAWDDAAVDLAPAMKSRRFARVVPNAMNGSAANERSLRTPAHAVDIHLPCRSIGGSREPANLDRIGNSKPDATPGEGGHAFETVLAAVEVSLFATDDAVSTRFSDG